MRNNQVLYKRRLKIGLKNYLKNGLSNCGQLVHDKLIKVNFFYDLQLKNQFFVGEVRTYTSLFSIT